MASAAMAPTPDNRRSSPPIPESPERQPLEVITPRRQIPRPPDPDLPVIMASRSGAKASKNNGPT